MADFIGHVELAHDYLGKIAALIGGEVRKTTNPGEWYVALKGTKQQPSAMALLTRPDDWLAIVKEYTDRLRTALLDAGGV